MSIVDRKDFYTGENDERTKSRLQQMESLGMKEGSLASFGVENVMDGFYIERVWRDSWEDFDGYLNWVRDLIKQNQPFIAEARKAAFEMLKGIDISRNYEARDGKITISVTLGCDDLYHIRYGQKYNMFHFAVTKEEMVKIQRGEV